MANFTANLVADKITSELFGKISEGKITAYSKAVDLYISNSGNDIPMLRGAGTQEKPFRTVEYVLSQVVPTLKSTHYVRLFAVDNIEVNSQPLLTSACNNLVFQKTDTGTFNFRQKVPVRDALITFYGCNFYNGIDLTQKAFCYISGGILAQGTNQFRARYMSGLLIDANVDDLVFEGASDVPEVFFDLYNSANLVINGSFTLKGNFGRFISASSNCFTRIAPQVVISDDGDISGSAYYLVRNSTLDLYGKGDSIFPEGLTVGSADQYSTIC